MMVIVDEIRSTFVGFMYKINISMLCYDNLMSVTPFIVTCDWSLLITDTS